MRNETGGELFLQKVEDGKIKIVSLPKIYNSPHLRNRRNVTSHFAPIDADIQVSKSGSGTVNYECESIVIFSYHAPITLDLTIVLNFAIDSDWINFLDDFGERFRERSVR